MRILGIDPGLATTGWGIIDSDKSTLKAIEYGIITTSPNLPNHLRLEIIHQDLTTLIHKYHPMMMTVEKLFFNTNLKTAMVVGQARGGILLTAAINKIDIHEFTPLQIKLNTVGYGQAEKIQVQKMVQRILKLEHTPKPDDAADALAVAICCAYQHKGAWDDRLFKRKTH